MNSAERTKWLEALELESDASEGIFMKLFVLLLLISLISDSGYNNLLILIGLQKNDKMPVSLSAHVGLQ